MSDNCNQDCESCTGENDETTSPKNEFSEQPHELSNIKKVIGVISGKGGVGKSLITSMLAVTMNRRGHSTAILDADITGPSIPKAFGIDGKATGSDLGMFPIKSKTGINIMSTNMLLANETDPVIWRGPIIAGTVKQFWTEVIWGDVDYMFIDMPPGTGDVPLTVFQSIAIDGIVIVTSPQELVSMIVSKAVKMAEMMSIPIIGIVENMSYFKCTDCDKEHKIFGESHIEDIANRHNIKVLAKLPIQQRIATACDRGMIELYEGDWMDSIAEILEGNESEKNGSKDDGLENDGVVNLKIAVASEGKDVTEHFGHCENFNIFYGEKNEVVKSESIPNPGHKPGFLPNFLNDLGVNVIIAGGMGGGAVDIFNEKGIEVIVGVEGDAKILAQEYLKGKLESTGSVCHEHSLEHKE